ncbi:MAG: hypothetical protein IPI95_15580 [Flavobacteriales bacterium]|nr:hypothetical protein [Flavobacteriales bacterium]
MDTVLTVQPAEDTYLARLDHGHSALKGVLNWDMFYEFGSGLEPRREFIYVQVPAGQGAYVWNDYNGNGVKELNEFEQAPFGYEADYIRVFVQTNETVRVFSNQLSASGELRPSAIWRDKKGLCGFLGKWNDVASFRSDRKTGDDANASAFNPFIIDPADTSLIALNSSVRNTIYYDRSSRKWSMDHTYQSDRGKEPAPERIRVAGAGEQLGASALEHHHAMDVGGGSRFGPHGQQQRSVAGAHLRHQGPKHGTEAYLAAQHPHAGLAPLQVHGQTE